MWNEEKVVSNTGTASLTWSHGHWKRLQVGLYGQIVEVSPIQFDEVEKMLSSFALAQISFIVARRDPANT